MESDTPITDLVRSMRKRKAAWTSIATAVMTLPRRFWPKKRARGRRLPSDWAELRIATFERDRYRCVYCLARTDFPHCDHVIPLSRGGASAIENLATACAPCNLDKGDRTPEEWIHG